MKSQLQPYSLDFSNAILPFVTLVNTTGSLPYSQYANASLKQAFLFSIPSKSLSIPSSPSF